MNKALEAAKAQQMLDAFSSRRRAWKNLAFMDIGRRDSISTNKAILDINSDAVLVSIMSGGFFLT